MLGPLEGRTRLFQQPSHGRQVPALTSARDGPIVEPRGNSPSAQPLGSLLVDLPKDRLLSRMVDEPGRAVLAVSPFDLGTVHVRGFTERAFVEPTHAPAAGLVMGHRAIFISRKISSPEEGSRAETQLISA